MKSIGDKGREAYQDTKTKQNRTRRAWKRDIGIEFAFFAFNAYATTAAKRATRTKILPDF